MTDIRYAMASIILVILRTLTPWVDKWTLSTQLPTKVCSHTMSTYI
jgi:hypothetical protein